MTPERIAEIENLANQFGLPANLGETRELCRLARLGMQCDEWREIAGELAEIASASATDDYGDLLHYAKPALARYEAAKEKLCEQ